MEDALAMQEFEVRDEGRMLKFAGDLLAHQSSHRHDKERWAEFTIYRTAAGQFILAGVARTRVPGESDHCWAQVSDRPQGVIERLHLYDGDGVRYLTNVAKRVLHEAAQKDEELAAAYAVEVVD